MDIVTKFNIALKFNQMDFKKFGEQIGVTKQSVSQTVAAMSVGLNRSARIQKAIKDFTQSQLVILKGELNKEIAA